MRQVSRARTLLVRRLVTAINVVASLFLVAPGLAGAAAERLGGAMDR